MLATLIDVALYTILINVNVYYVVASILSFSISLIFNYCLSMKFVFVASASLSKQKQFIIFIILSVIGCIINSIILYLIVELVYLQSTLTQFIPKNIAEVVAKMIATGVTMVYNFITKKIFLEERKQN